MLQLLWVQGEPPYFTVFSVSQRVTGMLPIFCFLSSLPYGLWVQPYQLFERFAFFLRSNAEIVTHNNFPQFFHKYAFRNPTNPVKKNVYISFSYSFLSLWLSNSVFLLQSDCQSGSQNFCYYSIYQNSEILSSSPSSLNKYFKHYITVIIMIMIITIIKTVT